MFLSEREHASTHLFVCAHTNTCQHVSKCLHVCRKCGSPLWIRVSGLWEVLPTIFRNLWPSFSSKIVVFLPHSFLPLFPSNCLITWRHRTVFVPRQLPPPLCTDSLIDMVVCPCWSPSFTLSSPLFDARPDKDPNSRGLSDIEIRQRRTESFQSSIIWAPVITIQSPRARSVFAANAQQPESYPL